MERFMKDQVTAEQRLKKEYPWTRWFRYRRDIKKIAHQFIGIIHQA